MAGLILLGITVTFKLFFTEGNIVKFFFSIVLLGLVILFNSHYLKDKNTKEIPLSLKIIIPIISLIDTVIFYKKADVFIFVAAIYFVLINLSFFFMAKRV